MVFLIRWKTGQYAVISHIVAYHFGKSNSVFGFCDFFFRKAKGDLDAMSGNIDSMQKARSVRQTDQAFGLRKNDQTVCKWRQEI